MKKALSLLRLFSYFILGVISWQIHVDVIQPLQIQMIVVKETIPVVVALRLF